MCVIEMEVITGVNLLSNWINFIRLALLGIVET